jgi:hypothetical protein
MVFVGQKNCSRSDWCGRGFALLLVLLAVAILAILYVIQMDAFFGPVSPVRKSVKTHRPWLEEGRIVPSDQLIKPPRPPKPAISKPLTMVALVRLGESDRGTATLEFAVSGEVRGTWSCEYSHKDRDYTMEATFAGNIDVSKTYSEGEVTDLSSPSEELDESRLYFITKGTYKQTTYNAETRAATSDEGLVYVDGWLHADYSVSGLITITTDKTWSASYEL